MMEKRKLMKIQPAKGLASNDTGEGDISQEFIFDNSFNQQG